MRICLLLATLLAGLLVGSGPVLADASGKALDVDRDARAETKAGVKELVVGSDLFIGDRVVTDARGLVQIKFSDNTKLVVGPNSALLLEDYLLRNDGSSGKFAINALSGTFRFVTGGAAKDRYLIKTPTGTIGVRGTAFDFNSAPAEMSLMLYHGSVQICNKAGKCISVDDVCEIGTADVTDARILGNTNEMTQAQRDQMRGMFPYAENQSPLLGQFRLDAARECLNRPVVPPPPEDSTSTIGGTPDQRFPNGGFKP